MCVCVFIVMIVDFGYVLIVFCVIDVFECVVECYVKFGVYRDAAMTYVRFVKARARFDMDIVVVVVKCCEYVNVLLYFVM